MLVTSRGQETYFLRFEAAFFLSSFPLTELTSSSSLAVSFAFFLRFGVPPPSFPVKGEPVVRPPRRPAGGAGIAGRVRVAVYGDGGSFSSSVEEARRSEMCRW